MAVSVAQNFYNSLVEILTSVTINEIKGTIGDSVNNNRIPTIRQVVRYLDAIGETTLAVQLDVVYLELKDDLADSRLNFRTDGFDINEFLNVFENVVLEGNAGFRRSLGRVIAAA